MIGQVSSFGVGSTLIKVITVFFSFGFYVCDYSGGKAGLAKVSV